MGPARTILRTSVSSAVSQECSQVACETARFNFENLLLCLRDRGFSLRFVRADSAESICTSFGTPSITQSLEGNSPSFLIEMSNLHLIHSFPICAARCCEALWYLWSPTQSNFFFSKQEVFEICLWMGLSTFHTLLSFTNQKYCRLSFWKRVLKSFSSLTIWRCFEIRLSQISVKIFGDLKKDNYLSLQSLPQNNFVIDSSLVPPHDDLCLTAGAFG